MELFPVTRREADAWIMKTHRHHAPTQGYKFAIGLRRAPWEDPVGVVVAGRPLSRHLDDGLTIEITRLATDGTANACSILYGAARRAAKAMGYRQAVTYTLVTESGVSLKASGWKHDGLTGGGSWSRLSRQRVDKAPTCQKVRWTVAL